MKNGTSAVILAVILMTGTALAADWNFYGSARVSTFFEDVDTHTAVGDTTAFAQDLQGNSRFGAIVKVNDTLTGCFEYGTGVNVRILAGEWNFGGGSLLVGQDESPMEIALSNMVAHGDENLNSYGNPYAGRNPMIRLSIGGFQIAAVEPASDDLGLANATTETKMPKIEASYTHDFNQGFVKVVGGYNTYELKSGVNAYEVDSYALGIGAKINLGSAYLGGNIYGGQNTEVYGMSCAADDDPQFDGTDMYDTDVFGYILVAGYRVNDMLSCEVGYGHVTAESDKLNTGDDEASAVYVNATISLAEGIFIVPELGYIDNDTDMAGAEESETVYYGAKWQVNF